MYDHTHSKHAHVCMCIRDSDTLLLLQASALILRPSIPFIGRLCMSHMRCREHTCRALDFAFLSSASLLRASDSPTPSPPSDVLHHEAGGLPPAGSGSPAAAAHWAAVLFASTRRKRRQSTASSDKVELDFIMRCNGTVVGWNAEGRWILDPPFSMVLKTESTPGEE